MANYYQLSLLAPEIFLASAACLVLLVDLYLSNALRRITYALTQLSLIGTAAFLISGWSYGEEFIFSGSIILDPMSSLLKLAVVVVVSAVLLCSERYLRERQLYQGEYFVLALFATLGMMILISSHSLLTIYLGLELLSLSMYAMVGLRRDSNTASEAAMKYFVLGALASGILLYGISIIYGVTGSLDIADIREYFVRNGMSQGAVFALIFVVVALGFKLGAVPFHMWLPDVYQGAPTAVTLFIASAPKIAGFALIMRLLVEGLGALHADWQGMLEVLAILSLLIGNLVAIAQTNFKRMLAYSTIAHVGFILLGILTGTQQGYASAMFYVLIYSLMTLGGFALVMFLSRADFEADALEDLKGLNQRSPWFALMMLVVLFSMAGVPPTAGFYAKFAVLREIVEVDLVWLAGIAVGFSVIGAFYYLRAVKFMYFDQPNDTAPLADTLSIRVVLSINGLALLALGVYPTALMALCAAAIR